MLTLLDITKSYYAGGVTLRVLNGASLELQTSDFCVISGPSGSGKSTLLNIIGCLDTPDSGEIRIDDTDISRLNDAQAARFRNTRIGFVFQSFHLIPVLSAAENVAYPLFLRGIPRKHRMERARELLAGVGLANFADRLPAKLSGGQRQRVAIARALACEPKIILADEPTANLDRGTAADIMALLSRLNEEEKVTLFIATHDSLVSRCARRRLFLTDGKISENAEQG